MHGRQAPKNTIGNVPLEWYRDYDHMGYTIDGKPLPKPAFAQMDAVDRFLASQDDPNFRWTVYDEQNGEEYVLSKRDVQILRNLQQGRYAHPEFNDTPVSGQGSPPLPFSFTLTISLLLSLRTTFPTTPPR